jgi:type VII secretion protein EccE
VSIVDSADAPALDAKETWRGLRGETGYVAAYDVKVDDRLADTLGEIRSLPSAETWTALEYTGRATGPDISAACAMRTVERPAARAPIRALTPLRGRHGPALTALSPLSTDRLIRT